MKGYIILVFFVIVFVCNSFKIYAQIPVNIVDIVSPPPLEGFIQLKSGTIDPPDLVKLQVPPYLWSYGCTNTAAAMLIGYYDQNCYKKLYIGRKNGGTAPFDNHFWESRPLAAPEGETYVNYNNSISASKNGFDDRNSNGHVDDYWLCMFCSGNDPHPQVNGYPPHPFGPERCTGDYMGTSQDYYNNVDAGTTFEFTSDNSKFYVQGSTRENDSPRKKNGMKGLCELIEACGYNIETCYSQPIFGYSGIQAGFTFSDFKAEIDAGMPVIITFAGHTCIGVGYSNSTQKIRIYTTWSETPWDMVWGSNLTADRVNSLPMIGVSVLKLIASYDCDLSTGINDVVIIENPKSGTIGNQGTIPNNTNLMTPCTNASFYANFQTDHDPTTYANTFDWKIVLYHYGGEYVYAQQNGILPNTSTPNGTGQGCVWQPALSALPAYNWSIDYSGNIYGKVSVMVHKDDGGEVGNDFEIGVRLYSEIKDITYAVNTTINATCAKLNLTNVGITSPASVTVNSNGLGIVINGTFVAQKGSTLKINK